MHFSHSCNLPPSLFLSLPLKIFVLGILCVSDYSTVIFTSCLSRTFFFPVFLTYFQSCFSFSCWKHSLCALVLNLIPNTVLSEREKNSFIPLQAQWAPASKIYVPTQRIWWGVLGFPGGSVLKNLTANAGDTGDLGSTSGSGRSPGGGNGNPLHCSCLDNSMGKGTRQATVHGLAKSWTQLSD